MEERAGDLFGFKDLHMQEYPCLFWINVNNDARLFEEVD